MNKMSPLLRGYSSNPTPRSSSGSTSVGSPRSLDMFSIRWLDQRSMERRLRYDVFSPEVVNDQGWLIVLELYRAQMQNRLVSPDQVADGVDLPVSTALRYVAHLSTHDLIERDDDSADSTLRLTDHGTRKLRSYFSKMARYRGAGGED